MTQPPPPSLPVVTIPEWYDGPLSGFSLGDADRPLADLLRAGGDGRLAIDELRSGLRVRSRSWVGVVRFSTFELRVVPKLVGGDLGLVRMIDYASGLDALRRYPAVHSFEAAGGSLFDLLSLLLAEAGERVARAGLRADYRETEDDLPVIRGRLLVRRQLRPGLRRLSEVLGDLVLARWRPSEPPQPASRI